MRTISAYQITHTIPCVSFHISIMCFYLLFHSLSYTIRICFFWLKTTFIFQKIINHVVARLWFYSFSQKTPYYFSFFRHPTMRCSHWLTYSLEGTYSLTFHFVSFHFTFVLLLSHPALSSPFFIHLAYPVLYACVCISARVFLTITLLILFYIFLLDFCVVLLAKLWAYCCEFWSLQSKSSSVVCVHSAHNLRSRFFLLRSHSTWHWGYML